MFFCRQQYSFLFRIPFTLSGHSTAFPLPFGHPLPAAKLLPTFPFTNQASNLFHSSNNNLSISPLYQPSIPHKMFHMSEEVQNALLSGGPIVALESALITHGLQNPLNSSVGLRLEQIVREEGAIPATIVLTDGGIRVGIGPEELKRIGMPDLDGNGMDGRMKVSLRDIPNCLLQKRIGGTTVAATIWIAHQMGIKVLGTGGIGGVHRGAEQTMDVSADLVELSRCPIAVVCAGVKSILDIGKTLEFLETQSVNVVVLDKQRNFPGFFSPRTEFLAPHCTESVKEVAQILAISEKLKMQSGLLLACPLLPKMLTKGERIERAILEALWDAEREGIRGKGTTPFVLKRVAELSDNESVKINICLLENNVRMAARLALEYAKMKNNVPMPIESSQNFASFGVKVDVNEQQKCDNLGENKPKIVCIGAAIVDFEVLPPSSPSSSRPRSPLPILALPNSAGQYRSARIVQRSGGVARNHADALTRLMHNWGEVKLVTALGQDGMDPGTMFLRQKGAHLDWSHSLFCSELPTATSIGINSFEEDGIAISHGFISVDHLMAKIDVKFIDTKTELIEAADFVLLDGNLGVEAIKRIAYWAQQGNTKIWFEPTNALKVPKLFAAFGPNPLAKVDIFSPNLAELREFVANLNGIERGECTQFLDNFEARLNFPLKSVREWLESIGDKFPHLLCPKSNLLVTCDRRGVLILYGSGQNLRVEFVGPPEIPSEEIVSVSGAGDCFNSGFLCAQLNGLGLNKSLELARECARISLRSADAVPEQLDNRVDFLINIYPIVNNTNENPILLNTMAPTKKTKSKEDGKSAMTTNAPVWSNDTTADANVLDNVAQATQPAPTTATVNMENKKKKLGANKIKVQTREAPKKRRFGRKPRRNFKIYVYKVLKKAHKELGISKRAIEVMDSFCNDMFIRIAAESGHLCQINNKKPTLNVKEVESASKLVLPGELQSHALNHGRMAVQMWQDC